METPSSTRRLIRSQAISAINNNFDSDSKIPFLSPNKTEDSGICQRKKVTAQEDRSALIDITNDSPIIGLAMQTPPSGFMVKRKNSRIIKSTPGSGEALLRGQVKTLLHKVEEGTELIHSIKTRPFIHLVTSPMRLLAPTPANTPQFLNFSDDEVKIRISSPVIAGHLRTSQEEASEIFEEKTMSITRSLLFDFTDKSASLEEEEEEVDGLCEGMKKMSAETTQAEFAGKHIRFLYNSEVKEITKEVLHLKGIPTPRGKHFRFATEEDEESSF